VGRYALTFQGLATTSDAEKQTTSAQLTLPDDELLLPGKSVWQRDNQNPTSEITIRSTALEDLYVVLADFSTTNQSATLLFFVNPMVTWLWIGGVIVVIGTIITAWPHQTASTRRAAATTQAARQASDETRSREPAGMTA
jgi:cytochrome c-type biogenesis protein CcmF